MQSIGSLRADVSYFLPPRRLSIGNRANVILAAPQQYYYPLSIIPIQGLHDGLLMQHDRVLGHYLAPATQLGAFDKDIAKRIHNACCNDLSDRVVFDNGEGGDRHLQKGRIQRSQRIPRDP